MTPKQSRFVDEYLVDGNATQAAIRAGYAERSARQIAAQNLTKHDIVIAVREGQRAVQERTQVTVDWVVTRIKEIAEEAAGEGDRPTAIRGMDLLMKHLGGYEADNHRSADMAIRFATEADEVPTYGPQEETRH